MADLVEPTAWRVDDLTASGKTCGQFALYTDPEKVASHLERNGARFCRVTALAPVSAIEEALRALSEKGRE